MQLEPIIPVDDKVPGIHLKMSFGVGPSSAGDAPRSISITGNMSSSGSATAEKEYLVLSPDEASDLFGPGSELHLMAKEVFGVYPSALLYACAITESVGTAATGTCAFTGTATAAGVIEVECVKGEKIYIPVAKDDAHTDVSPAVAAAINDQTEWPVTAADVTGTTTVTAKHKGPRGNAIPLRCVSKAAGITVTPPATGYLTSGATDDDPENALDAINPNRRHYVVAPYDDATNLADYKAFCVDDSDPTVGQREVWVAGCIDTLANATTLATTLNPFRGQIAWHENGDCTPAMMAAALAAYRCLRESTKLSYNYDGDVLPGITAQADDSDIPNYAALKSALNNGLTPLLSQKDGTVTIVRSITARSQDSSGNPSYNALDTSKIIVPYGVADNVQAEFAGEKYRNRNIEVGDADGIPKTPSGITAPMARDTIFSILKDMENAGDIENVDANASALAVQNAKKPAGRFIASIPCDVVEGFHQLDGDVRQVG